MEVGDKVIVIPTNGIGQIIDKGTDSIGTWYRTDVDGVRSLEELRPYEGSLEEANIKLHKLVADLHKELANEKDNVGMYSELSEHHHDKLIKFQEKTIRMQGELNKLNKLKEKVIEVWTEDDGSVQLHTPIAWYRVLNLIEELN